MKRVSSVILLLALAAHADAAKLTIPAEVKAAPGKWLVVTPDTDCAAVDYVALDGLEAFPSSELKDPRKLVVQAPATPGRWRFVAVGTLKDELARAEFAVVVGDAPPSPPGPGPAPGPTDPFTKAIQEAYAAEADPAKAKQAEWLAAIYRGAPALLDAPGADTAGGLFAKLKSAIHNPGTGIPEGALPKVSKVVGADLNAALGGTAAGVDPGKSVDKAAAKAAFARYAAALGGLK